MATQNYECLFIFDSNSYARDARGCATAVEEALKNFGGEILVSRLWAEQRLAYPIKGHQKGTYWLTYFKMDSVRVPELNRVFQLNETIIRFLVTSVDARLVDALVAHALGKTAVVEGDGEARKPVLVGALDEEEEEVEVEGVDALGD